MHPQEADLALYAGGEASPGTRWRVAWHLRVCAVCARAVEEFRAVREWTRVRDELPAGVEWVQLAAEMRANIRVGLAAGECVGPAAQAAPWRPWRPALVLPVLLMMVLGWWLQSWPPPAAPLAERATSEGVVVRGNPRWIELEQDGRALALLHPRATEVTFSASGQGVRARYVDAETGYVTISHVYSQ